MDSKSGLFRQSSLDRISSPDQLNDYIRVSNPSVWILIAALFALLAGLGAWGIMGSLPTKVNAAAIVRDGKAVCYLDPATAGTVRTGQSVEIKPPGQDATVAGSVSAIGQHPLSYEEIGAELGSDYLTQALSPGGFAVRVEITPYGTSLTSDSMVNLAIITAESRPIDFLIK